MKERKKRADEISISVAASSFARQLQEYIDKIEWGQGPWSTRQSALDHASAHYEFLLYHLSINKYARRAGYSTLRRHSLCSKADFLDSVRLKSPGLGWTDTRQGVLEL